MNARCWHTETLAAYEREEDRRAELEAHIEQHAPALAQRCLDSAMWCDKAMGEDPIYAAISKTGILLTDPCEYGRLVKAALEQYANNAAWEWLRENPGETEPEVMEFVSKHNYWRRVV